MKYRRGGKRSGSVKLSAWLGCIALGASLTWSSAALAQSDPDELAKVHFTAGAAYFEQGEYDDALREFQKAHELSRRADLLLNIASVHERLNHLDQAITALDQFLAEKPDEPNSDTVRIRRDNLIKRRDNEAAAAGPQVAAAPAPQSAPPAAAQPQPATEPAPAQSPVQDAAPPGDNRGAGYVFLTIGGATAVGAVLTGLIASGKHSDAKDTCSPACSDEELSAGRALATTSTVLTGVALVSSSLGLYFILSSSDAPDGASARLELNPTPGGAYANAKWRF